MTDIFDDTQALTELYHASKAAAYNHLRIGNVFLGSMPVAATLYERGTIEWDLAVTIITGVFTRHTIITDNDTGKIVPDKRHGGPFERGSADAYYGRSYNPHYMRGSTLYGTRIESHDMSPFEIHQYAYGYDTQDDRKQWD